METIGMKLKTAMKSAGVSQTALANALGISQQQVSYNLGRDESEMSVGFVLGACKVIGVSPASVLLPGEEMGINPVIAPIVEELDRIVAEKSKAEQELTFRAVYAMVKAV